LNDLNAKVAAQDVAIHSQGAQITKVHLDMGEHRKEVAENFAYIRNRMDQVLDKLEDHVTDRATMRTQITAVSKVAYTATEKASAAQGSADSANTWNKATTTILGLVIAALGLFIKSKG
jgi:hypothetical protein